MKNYFRCLPIIVCLLTFSFSNAQEDLYSKKVEVYNESGNTRLVNSIGNRIPATFDNSSSTSSIYDAEGVEGGVLIRNNWTISYYDNDLNKVSVMDIGGKVDRNASSDTYLRKSGDFIYVIRATGPRLKFESFRELNIYVLPVNGDVESYKEIKAELPEDYDRYTFSCEIRNNKIVSFNKRHKKEEYAIISIDLSDGTSTVTNLELPSSSKKERSKLSYESWSHLFTADNHLWVYEFFTGDRIRETRNVITHAVKLDFNGKVLKDNKFDILSLIDNEMKDLYSKAPGLTFDPIKEKIYVVGPVVTIGKTEDATVYIYFAKYDLNSGQVDLTNFINVSEIIGYFPSKYGLTKYGLRFTNRFDPTQLDKLVPVERPVYYDQRNKSIIVDYYYGLKENSNEKVTGSNDLRLILDEEGDVYRFGMIGSYTPHLLHGRQVKFFVSAEFISKFLSAEGDPRSENYQNTGYDLFSDEIFKEDPRRNGVAGTVIQKDGMDFLVVFEAENFRTTLYKL